MTTIARSFRHPEPALVRPELDVRCSAFLPHRPAAEGRCQLFAGHDGPHALMFGRCGERTVRTWTRGAPQAVLDTRDLQRPWMFGYPVPAWFETDADTELAG